MKYDSFSFADRDVTGFATETVFPVAIRSHIGGMLAQDIAGTCGYGTPRDSWACGSLVPAVRMPKIHPCRREAWGPPAQVLGLVALYGAGTATAKCVIAA